MLIGPSGSQDTEGRYDAVRRFEVVVYDVNEALTTPDLPALGTPHPSRPGLVLDRKQAVQREDGVYFVDCLYSNYGAFTRGTIDRKADDYVRWTYTRKTVAQKIPWASRVEREIPKRNGGSETVYVWEAMEPKRVDEIRVLINAEVTVPKLSFSQYMTIINRIGKLHRIGNRQYRFSASDPTPLTEAKDVLTYTWEIDAGTFAPANPNNQDITLPPPLAGYEPLCRRPYHGLVMLQSGDIQARPLYDNVRMYEEDDDGYIGLPGIPL